MNVEYKDLATPRLKSILGELQPPQRRKLLRRLASELDAQLKAHFLTRNQEGNAKGFPTSNWWNREARSKTGVRAVSDDEATVGVNSAQFRFKLTGGTIKPGPGKKYLAIPTRAEAYGRRPSQAKIPGLFFRRLTGGRAYLAARDGQALRVYWRLIPQATIPADPRALPPVADLRAALERVAESEVARIAKQAGK